MPQATQLYRVGMSAERAVKRIKRNHFCSNKDRGDREGTE